MNEQYQEKKWTVVTLLWLAMFASHIIRVSLAVVAPTLRQTFGISPEVMGWILAGWNWVYTPSLLLAGAVVDRFGPWIVTGIGAGGWGLVTMVLPIASTAVGFFVMRALFGASHSMLVPGNASAISRFFKKEQRATAVGITFSGNQVGLAMGTTIAAYILATMGWKAVFYVMGGASVILALLWLGIYPDKRVGRQVAPKQNAVESSERVPWTSLLGFRATWGIFFGQMGYLYAYFFFSNWVFTYLIEERKMSTLRSGFYGSLPFWAGMLGTLAGGVLGDYLIRKGFSRTVSRKSIIGAGFSLSTVLVITAAYTQDVMVAVLLLTLSLGFLRVATASVNSTPIDLAPAAAVASLTGIHNFGGNIGGLLAPIVTGYIYGSSKSFVLAFVVTGAMALLGGLSYIFLLGSLDEPLKIKR